MQHQSYLYRVSVSPVLSLTCTSKSETLFYLPPHSPFRQIWEAQEYLSYCPMPVLPYPALPLDATGVVEARTNIDAGVDGDNENRHSNHPHDLPLPPPLPQPSSPPPFRLFVYPSAEEGKLPAVYQAVRAALMASPYRTLDPNDASIFIPDTDVSCWCESCFGNKRPLEAPARRARNVTARLQLLQYWGMCFLPFFFFFFSFLSLSLSLLVFLLLFSLLSSIYIFLMLSH